MTEIFGTLGPACADQNILTRMFENGMTGMRLNLSHTSLDESAELIRMYQRAAASAGARPELLIDMQGPELRVGPLDMPLSLPPEGSAALSEEGDGIPVPDGFIRNLENGDEILLDDGLITLRVIGTEQKKAVCSILHGGVLGSRKTIKIVGKDIYGPVLTEHDLLNLSKARSYGVTALVQPFVRDASDLVKVRSVLKNTGLEDLRVFAKIEDRQGIANLEGILEYTDMLIIARGDLGNDMPLWELPAAQKHIAAVCRKRSKPFVVVTQMLTSMIHSPVPTRAEVSDVFNAVLEGAAAVMVTNETTVGEFPAEVIRYMTRIAEEARKYAGVSD